MSTTTGVFALPRPGFGALAGMAVLSGACGCLAFCFCTVWRDPRLDPRAAA